MYVLPCPMSLLIAACESRSPLEIWFLLYHEILSVTARSLLVFVSTIRLLYLWYTLNSKPLVFKILFVWFALAATRTKTAQYYNP
jgi:hypothetical protein